MCGITGIFCPDPRGRVARDAVEAMSRTLAHRGPDGSGVRLGPGYGLGHQRLAIVDRAKGDQPMCEDSGQVWVTFNGEIYNHDDLRQQLTRAGYRFETRCDTEVLLNGYREWGVDLPQHLVGMFAFAIVDESEHVLFAARDRMGQKPFYYVRVGDEVLFASEIKALLVDPRVRRRVCPEALSQFLCLGYVPDPRTIYVDIHKLPPASFMSIRAGHVEVREYWSPALHDGGSSWTPSLEDQKAQLEDLFDVAVQGRLMGEVPLGAFLSGGVDSYAVVDSMSRVSSAEVVACTVGFDEPAYDERVHARAAASACGARLHEEVLKVEDMLDLDWFAEVYDEPFADSSAIPTYHVSRMARRHVTVALSGDGGDESFAGYRRYLFDVNENKWRGMLPRLLWSTFGAVYPKLDLLPRWLRFKRTLQNLGCTPEEAYARSVSRSLPEEIRPLLRERWRTPDPLAPVRDAHREAAGCDPLARCAHADRRTWLPGDILTKVDRASMAVSLEVRSPFLDHRIVELAAGLSADRNMLHGESKGFLRHTLADRLGRDALDRPKRGFSVPLGHWMRGPLGDALASALRDGPLEEFVDVPAVERLLAEHRGGLRRHETRLWSFLVLSRFLQRWVS